MRVDLFDYELPPQRIAAFPAEPRDSSRLLILDRNSGALQHDHFRNLPHHLKAGDVLVVNDTRVLPARLLGCRTKTAGRWEGLFLRADGERWELMTKTRGKPEPGEVIAVEGADWFLTLLEKTGRSTWLAQPSRSAPPHELLAGVGHVPLPPYIRGGKDRPDDQANYQTVFADRAGAVAAPTAGLHFTPGLITNLEKAGVPLVRVTLHVGPGTFQPVTADDTKAHVMHEEWCELSPDAAHRLRAARVAGGRIIAVGTTSVRTLESIVHQHGDLVPWQGHTRLFIVPGFEFRAVDALITNFHLPKSTLLMLVAALAGRENTLHAYREAIHLHYRFYSYGDAMLII
jgi:S-adenosylmethionine:tRNA ribosyltransferase-isomerase